MGANFLIINGVTQWGWINTLKWGCKKQAFMRDLRESIFGQICVTVFPKDKENLGKK
jgi:hypothetical protein